jgi:rubredoxin
MRDEDDSDEFDEDNLPDDDDLPDGVYHDDQPSTATCPQCRTDYWEDAVQCPACGYMPNRETDFVTPRSSFFWVMMAITLGLVLLGCVTLLF